MRQLPDQIREKIFNFLVLALEVAVQVCDADMHVVPEPRMEVVHDNGSQDCLASSWDAWTEEGLVRVLSPLLIFRRVQQLLLCACLSTSDEIALLAAVVNRCDLVEDGFVLLVRLLALLLFPRLCDLFVDVGTESKGVYGYQAVQGPALTVEVLDGFPCLFCQEGPFEPLLADPVALGSLRQVVEKTV